MKLLRKAGAIFNSVNNRLIYGVIALIVFSWLAVCFHVFFRYFLRSPFSWTVEIVSYTLLWMTFLGAAWLLRSEGHVRLDVVVNQLSPRAQAIINFITSIVGAVTCLFLTYYGALTTWVCWKDPVVNGRVPPHLECGHPTQAQFRAGLDLLSGGQSPCRNGRSKADLSRRASTAFLPHILYL